jgi:hypothetical protein
MRSLKKGKKGPGCSVCIIGGAEKRKKSDPYMETILIFFLAHYTRCIGVSSLINSFCIFSDFIRLLRFAI